METIIIITCFGVALTLAITAILIYIAKDAKKHDREED